MKGTPPELLREFKLLFCRKGEILEEMACESRGQRLQVIQVEGGPVVDEIRLIPVSTYGSENAVVFEVRVYGE